MIPRCFQYSLFAWGPAAFLISLAPAAASPFQLVIQNGHTRAVNDVAFSPDDSLLASASDDRLIKLWTVDGSLLRDIAGHAGDVTSVAFFPDGRALVSGSKDGTAKVWNLQGDLLRTLSGHKRGVNAIAVSPDGKRIVTGGEDGLVRLWGARDGALEKTLNEKNAHYVQIRSVAFSPDGARIAAGAHNLYGRRTFTIQLWDRRGRLIKNFKNDRVSANVNAVAFSPDGKTIAACAGTIVGFVLDKSVSLWDLDGRLLHKLEGHTGRVEDVVFHPDGRSILSGAADGTLKQWSINGKLIRTIRGHRVGVTSVAYSSDGARIASGATSFFGEASAVRLWDARGRPERVLEGRSSGISGLGLVAGGTRVVAALDYPEAALKFWGLDGRLFFSIPAHRGGVRALAVASQTGGSSGTKTGGERLATCDYGGAVKLRTGAGRLSRTFGEHGVCYSLAFHPRGQKIALASGDHTIRLRDPGTGERKTFHGHLDNVYSVQFHPDGNRLLSASADGTVRMWSSAGEALYLIRYPDSVADARFAPDGRSFATVLSRSEDIELRAARDGALIRKFAGSVFAFHPDGRRMAIGTADKKIHIVDLKTGRRMRTIRGTPGSLLFTPDGRNLISGAWDRTVKIWNLKSGQGMSLLSAGDEWIMYTPDGYFDSSRLGGRLVAMSRGRHAFGIDQFAVRYNRPDIILERQGRFAPELLAFYRGLYRRRLRRMGLGSGERPFDLHVPTARITGQERRGKTLSLDLECRDAKYDLRGYNVFVNNVPLYGGRGGGRVAGGRRFRRRETIQLTRGDNKIEVACWNARGVESYRTRTHAAYNEEESAENLPDLYYLGFGVSRYKNPALDLRYAHKDARDLGELLAKMAGAPGDKRFNRVRTRLYLDEAVTIANIKKARDFLAGARVDDILVLFIAGHGVFDRAGESRYYYLTHETDIHNLAGTAASFELIESLLQEIAPRKKLFLLDTCESGEVDPEDRRSFRARANRRGIRARTTRAIAVLGKDRPKRPFLYQKDRYIYNDLARRSGAVVFSASRGGEYSYESEKIENGFFTREILNALSLPVADENEDGLVNTDELRRYVSRAVAEKTGDLQHPTVDRDNIWSSFGLPLAPSRTAGTRPAARIDLERSKLRRALKKLKVDPGSGDPALLETLSLSGSSVKDEDLQVLKDLKSLRFLNLSYSGISDRGLKRNLVSDRLKHLETLNLTYAKITGAGLKRVTRLPALRLLDLSGTKIEAGDFDRLAGLTRLEELYLGDTKQKADARYLRDMQRLEILDLSRTDIDDRTLSRIKRLKRLRRLNLFKTKISDRGLASLRELSRLESLILGENKITDAGLAHIRELPRLRGIDLRNTDITNAGEAALAKARPKLYIRRYAYERRRGR